MFTILRKIRKRLIAKRNFFSYLLYAIGEILLVVIDEQSEIWRKPNRKPSGLSTKRIRRGGREIKKYRI